MSHELRHADRFAHTSIDDDGNDGSDDLEREVSSALEAERASIDECFAESLAHLRVLAQQDKPVLLLLDAYAQRTTERHAVMSHRHVVADLPQRASTPRAAREEATHRGS